MSVNRSGNSSTGYDNLEIQILDNELNVQSDATSAKYEAPQYVSVEPLGGISRGEVAELVGIIGQVSAYSESIGGNTDPGSCRFEYSLSLDPEINGGRVASNEKDIDGQTGIDVNEVNAVDPDLLQNYVLAPSNEFNELDTTNGVGTGGGGTTFVSYDVQLDYQSLFGGGPVLDRHDRLYQHANLTLVGDTNSEYSLLVRQNLLWDVRDE